MSDSPSSSFSVGEEFLRVSRHELQSRHERTEKCVARLSPEQLWQREHEIENAVGNLLLHLSGNVEQWILSGVGGAPDRRDRDAEFAQREPLAKDVLLTRLRETVRDACTVLAGLREADLLSKRRIQVYEVTVLQAVAHVVAHFAEHSGQIIWATKRLRGEDLGFYGYLKGGTPPAQAQP